MLSLDALLLWGLFTLNLIGISCVESAAGAGDAESVPAQWPWLGRQYAWLLSLFTVVTAVACVRPDQAWAGNRLLPMAVLASLLLHGLVWIFRSRCTPLSYRVLTDLALVLPTVWVLLS
jgi:cell division protein FtsW (lipid II flippase)